MIDEITKCKKSPGGDMHSHERRLASSVHDVVVWSGRANSVTWNPHKLMGVELQCSAILVRQKVRTSHCHQFFCSTFRCPEHIIKYHKPVIPANQVRY